MNFIINRKTLISMLFIAMTMLGFISYQKIPFELIPNAELPQLVVNVISQIEVEPSYLEKNGVIPLEGAIGTLENIESIESVVDRQKGEITINYNKDVDTKYAFLKLQEKIDLVRKELPEEFYVQISRVSLDFINQFFMGLEVIGSEGTNRIRRIADEKILTKLENIDGVSSVDIFGGKQKSVIITLNEALCKSHDITTSQVQRAIQQHRLEKTYIGKVYEKEKRLFVNIGAEYNDIQDIENIPIGNGNLRLKNIADIYFGFQDETSYSRVNGKETIYISVQRDPSSNMIELSRKIKDEIARLNKTLKYQDIEILVQYNTAEIMENNLDQIIRLSITGAILAIIVLWVFLRNLRLILIIAFSIPISVYTAFNFFYAFDITINNLTMVGIILAIGMLVDNSVVVLENIYRLVSKGQSNRDAVINGTREVFRPVIAATLTTITVFLPFLFASNFFIKLFGANIGISIVTTLIISLLAALLLVPMVTHSILTKYYHNGIKYFQNISIRNILIHRYIVLLKACIRRPALTIFGSISIFFIVIIISLLNSKSQLQEAELTDITVYVTMPSGSTLNKTDEIVKKVEEKLMDLKEKEKISSQINEENAQITIKLVEDYHKKFKKDYAEIKEDIKRKTNEIKNAEISFESSASSGSGNQRRNRGNQGMMRFLGLGTEDEQVIIKGKDFELMRSIAENIRTQIDALTNVSSVNMNIRDEQPEMHLNFKQPIVAEYEIPLNNVLAELNSFSKQVNTNTSFRLGDEEYDIIIRTDNDTVEEKDKTINELKTLPVTNNDGASFELQEISDIVYSSGMREIVRVNQEKQIEITYAFSSETTQSKELLEISRNDIDNIISSMNIPSGLAVEVVHEENQNKEFKWLILAAIILIYMILASIFESFYAPVVIMFTIPLAAIGSIAAVALTGNSILNPNVLMGFMILLGIVVNNGIILIDYINLLKKRGYNNYRAIMTAGISRVRPIFITAITTIIAMLPLAMGKSEYLEIIGAPFAITVIGGLSFSTLLTLIFIPTLYTSFRNAILWFKSLPLKIILLQTLIFVLFVILVILNIEKLIFRITWIFFLFIAIPGVTYLIMNSLRIASARIIPEDETINITVGNLVKIYDREKRFNREWNYSKRFASQYQQNDTTLSFRNFEHLWWQIPLLGYLIYFIYFYLEHRGWSFWLVIINYFYMVYMLQPLKKFFSVYAQRKRNQKPLKILQIFLKILYWGYPVPNLVWFWFKWENTPLLIFIAILWYLALIIYAISNKIYKENINIQRLEGKLLKFRYFIYNLVTQIPLIGKKQQSFKALRGVSLEIGTGMFGLLGPNGAGKSTMMKIICGVIDQSYGKIWINGYDTEKYREELQGLIGYLPQEFGMYENMTAYNYLDYLAILKNISDPGIRKERVEYVLREVNMEEHAHEKINSFSGGMKQRIGIAQILLHLPRILIVDEPTAGIDPRERIRFRNLLIELSSKRIVLFSTHIIEDISSSCNRVAVLNKGKVTYLGNPKDMTKIAEGHVWQFFIPASDFEEIYNRYIVINHMRDGDRIRIRCLSDNKPVEEAEMVTPNLEDAYLWLQKK